MSGEITYDLETLPNPMAAAVWLRPELIPWYIANKYVYALVLGAFLWDILGALGEEFRIFKERPMAAINIVYIMSRIVSLGTMIATFVFTVSPYLNCTLALHFSTIFGSLATPLNSLLFLVRVNAVYHHSRLAMTAFTFLWLLTCTALMGPWTTTSSTIGPTSFCIVDHTVKFSGAVYILVTVFDTAVLLAVTLHVISISFASTRSGLWLRALTKGEGMGKLSKVLLQTGQLYYLVTVGFHITTTIVLLASLGPGPFHQLFPVINVTLHNAMACKVFRLLKLNSIQDTSLSLGEVTSSFFGHLPTQSNSTGMVVRGKRDIRPASSDLVLDTIHVHESQAQSGESVSV